LRARWGAKPNDLVVIHVSRLAAEKNYPLLLDSFRAIQTTQPNAKFVIVSDGPLRKKLQRQNPWVHFTGFLSRTDLAQHYASADLFPYPSQTETFGNVVTEAMASGLPVVAYRYAAAARYIRQGENGWHVSLGDSSAFVEAATRTALDAPLRQRLGKSARETAETIPWDTVINGFERDLIEIAGLPPSPSRLSVAKAAKKVHLRSV